jgi:hypothetical protein
MIINKGRSQRAVNKPGKRTVIGMVALLGCWVLPILAEHHGFSDRDLQRDVAEIVLSEVLFGDHDRRILDEYLRAELKEHPKQKRKKLPPGLRKKLARGGELPPGWQNKLARWEVMDETTYRHSTKLPEQILRQLSAGPRGTSIRRVEDRIVRIIDATHTILDVLSPGARH